MKQTFTVTGMKCEHCKARVEDAVKSLTGVTAATANLQDKTVEVDYNENAVTPATIKEAVDSLGRFELVL